MIKSVHDIENNNTNKDIKLISEPIISEKIIQEH
jgi:hypothetical protein